MIIKNKRRFNSCGGEENNAKYCVGLFKLVRLILSLIHSWHMRTNKGEGKWIGQRYINGLAREKRKFQSFNSKSTERERSEGGFL